MPRAELYVQSERDMIANALYEAGQMMSDVLGFFPRPHWTSERIFLGRGAWYDLQPHNLSHGYIQEFGVRTTSLIQAGVSVVYSDSNSDGTDDTVTITVTTSVDAGEIAVFFRVADGAESAGHEHWEIEPLTVTVSGGVATITGSRYLFVHPANIWAKPYEQPNFNVKEAGNTQGTAAFVTAVDVYRVYSDSTSAATMNSDPIWCYGCSTSLGTNTTSVGTGRILDSRLSIVQVRPSSCCSTCGTWPETVDVYYKAGYPLANGKMDRRLEQALIRLANTLIPYQPPTFNDRTLNMWKEDRQYVQQGQVMEKDLSPFGNLMRGRVEAWSLIKRMALGSGSKATQKWR